MAQPNDSKFITNPDDLHNMLANAFEEYGAACDHSKASACPDCLARIALDTLRRYLNDFQAQPKNHAPTSNARAVLKGHILG